ncbi:MAG: ATP-binding protein, partial [Thermoplasmatota archaeon]
DVAALVEREAELARNERAAAAVAARLEEVARRASAEIERAAGIAGRLAPVPLVAPADEEQRAARARAEHAERAARDLAALDARLARREELAVRERSLVEASALYAAAVAVLEAKVAAVGYDDARAAAAQRDLARASALVADARVARERTEEAARRVAEDRERLAIERAEAVRRADEVAALREELAVLERVAGDRDDGLLVEFKDRLLGRVRPMLSEHASGLFRLLTDGRYSDLELDEDYELAVRDDGESFRLERFSGGEADLANLALRLAIGEVVAERAGGAEFHFLALDEIFGSQDEVRKGNILRALADLSGKFRQILVITHVEDVKDSVEHVFRVTERPDGTSEVIAE